MNAGEPAMGRVYLVGAGPGDPGLITLRGVECLARADVILYDYLVNPRILAHARPQAERICLGQHGRGRIWTQTEIETAILEHARLGKSVVRLKAGDPMTFARGADEIESLQRAGVSYEVVAGITAALAAGSCAGIPLTHRERASAVALVTGHEENGKPESALDYASLARFPGTLVFYMGVTTAPVWVQALIDSGKPPDTPAAIIRRCSFPDQRVIRCRLGDVSARIEEPPRIRPPAIVIVGAVASFEPSVSWFERRPLFGRAILVTRAQDQADELAHPLAELGAEVLIQPSIRISAPPRWDDVDAALARLPQFEWLVFSSANGVRFLLDRLLQTGRDVRALGGVKLAAIGTATADELARYHLRADVTPDQFRAESLAAALVEPCRGRRCLLARASRGREVLAETLTGAGATVEQVVVYESTDIETPDPEVAARLANGKIDWVTVTSSAIARSLSQLFGDDLRKSRLASISPVTSETLRSLGLEPAAEASQYSMPGVVEAIVTAR